MNRLFLSANNAIRSIVSNILSDKVSDLRSKTYVLGFVILSSLAGHYAGNYLCESHNTRHLLMSPLAPLSGFIVFGTSLLIRNFNTAMLDSVYNARNYLRLLRSCRAMHLLFILSLSILSVCGAMKGIDTWIKIYYLGDISSLLLILIATITYGNFKIKYQS
jgi:hypothetical protein